MKSILVVGGTFRYKEYHFTEYGFFGGCDVEKYVNLCYKYKVKKWTKIADLQKNDVLQLSFFLLEVVTITEV